MGNATGIRGIGEDVFSDVRTGWTWEYTPDAIQLLLGILILASTFTSSSPPEQAVIIVHPDLRVACALQNWCVRRGRPPPQMQRTWAQNKGGCRREVEHRGWSVVLK